MSFLLENVYNYYYMSCFIVWYGLYFVIVDADSLTWPHYGGDVLGFQAF